VTVVRRADVLRLTAGSSRGTGLAIAPNRALTSLHAVGAVVNGALVLHHDTVEIVAEVTDSDGETEVVQYPVCTCTVDDVVDFDRELDWIVFDLDASMLTGMVLPVLAAVAPEDAGASCATYGFPDAGVELGAAADGIVVSLDAEVLLGAAPRAAIQVRSAAAAASGGAASGYLGAPVAIGRHVIGLVCGATASADGSPAEGVLHAIPLAALAERLRLALHERHPATETATATTAPDPPVLTGTRRAPKLSGPLARLRARFRGARPQIDMLGRYTELHDALHQLEPPFHAIDRERVRLAAAPRAWDELRDPLDRLPPLVARALGLLDDPRVADEFAATRQRLDDAAASLPAAIAGDPAALHDAMLQLRRVLVRDVSSASHRLRGALHELGLGDVVTPLRAALDALPRDDTSDPLLDELLPLVGSLEALHAGLDGLVRSHDAWQGIAGELGFLADTGRAALDDARRAWPVVRANLDDAMHGAGDAGWTGAIAAAGAQLDAGLGGNARPGTCIASLRALWRACHRRFLDVHRQLVTTCEELVRVSTTLSGVLDRLKVGDG
jgi:hypothetical protein